MVRQTADMFCLNKSGLKTKKSGWKLQTRKTHDLFSKCSLKEISYYYNRFQIICVFMGFRLLTNLVIALLKFVLIINKDILKQKAVSY